MLNVHAVYRTYANISLLVHHDDECEFIHIGNIRVFSTANAEKEIDSCFFAQKSAHANENTKIVQQHHRHG